MAPGIALAVSLAVHGDARGEDITKSGLTIEAANAEVLIQTDKGMALVGIDVQSDGKTPKFSLTFTDRERGPGRIFLAANHNTLIGEIQAAQQHGGVIFLQLKGYRVGDQVCFAFVTEVLPPNTQVRFKALFDVPAPVLVGIVDQERAAGGRLADTSTYEAPDGRTYHTAVFLPR